MAKPLITIDNIGKKYRITHSQDGRSNYVALRDVLSDTAKKITGKVMHPFKKKERGRPAAEDFWALRNISFDINPGDRIGIIGRNGAGKSTLLKVLSRITEPTEGRITMRGRVASLLEVGTGFHPELTGRENIYLNGAILGMSRREIDRKFDEIVDFSGVEKFLDVFSKQPAAPCHERKPSLEYPDKPSDLNSISPALPPAKSATRKILLRLWGTPQYWASSVLQATSTRSVLTIPASAHFPLVGIGILASAISSSTARKS